MRRLISLLSIAIFLPVAIAQAATPPVPKQNPAASGASTPVVSQAQAQQAGLAPKATANLQKKFTLEGFFAGKTIAKGTIFSKTVGAGRSFNMSTVGTWDGKVLTLVENYQYAAGDNEQRIWKFTKTGNGTYTATSKEILKKINVVIKGRVASFKYQKKLPRPGKSPVKVTFTEQWTLNKNGTLSSTAKLTKLVRVGREAINFARAGNEAALKAPGF
ncbi:MAG: DUF3833 family protein [Hyphomicrobiales bacterium]